MSKTDERQELWGGETAKAVGNFPVSGETDSGAGRSRWLGRIKGCGGARELPSWACSTAISAERIAGGRRPRCDGILRRRVPVDIYQTGSGTSTNMNANEVIANLANERLGLGVGGRGPRGRCIPTIT